jgi:hypothetical protein
MSEQLKMLKQENIVEADLVLQDSDKSVILPEFLHNGTTERLSYQTVGLFRQSLIDKTLYLLVQVSQLC